jgi:cytochrome c biogenesis protein CcmG, thiol:disulfide interchange protein DsbE
MNKLKKFSSILKGILFVGLIAFIAYRQLPVIYQNIQSQGDILAPRQMTNLLTNEELSFPPEHKSLIIFWASWCGPCIFEMNRLAKAVEAREIATGKVYGVNPFESLEEQRKYLSKNSYPFIFLADDRSLGRNFNVRSTPTFVMLDGNTVVRVSSGVNVLGLWRLKRFLAN